MFKMGFEMKSNLIWKESFETIPYWSQKNEQKAQQQKSINYIYIMMTHENRWYKNTKKNQSLLSITSYM